MAEGEDSRPFLVMKQNASDFKAVFDRDVKTLLDTLDSKITELLRNPETLTSSTGAKSDAKRLNAHMEFSKAKLDIFVALKDEAVQMTDQWIEHLCEVRDTFVENVEIFLAGTKLEVPKEEVSNANRKSLSINDRKKLQSPPVSSLYPKISDIPVLKNFLPMGDVQTSEPQNVSSSPVLKPIRKQSALPELDSPGPGRKKNSVRFIGVENTENVEMVEEEESGFEVEKVEAPVVKKGRGRPSHKNSARPQTPLRKAIAVKALQNEVLEAAENSTIDVVQSPSSGGRVSRMGPATPSSVSKTQQVENVEMVEEEESSGSEVEKVEAPVVKRGRGRPSHKNSAKPQTPLRKAIAVKALQNEVLEAAEKSIMDVVQSPSRGSRVSRMGPATPSSVSKTQQAMHGKNETEISSDSSISGDEPPSTPRSIAKAKRGSKMSVTEVVTPVKGTPGRRGRKPAAPEPVVTPQPVETSPRTKNFPHGLNLTEDLEIFSPVVNISRVAPRRKTVILQDLGFTPEAPKSKPKRKTIGGDLNFSSGTPSKRLKMSARSSLSPEDFGGQESDDSDHLEGENTTDTGKYTQWVSLSDIGASVPPEPGVYELKVSQAKKPAYIGGCESLRQRLTLHRLRHAASGHKHLDKFVERNANNLLVRYETADSLAAAKALEKTRVNAFVAVHNTTPAYN